MSRTKRETSRVRRALAALPWLLLILRAFSADLPSTLPQIQYHLAPQPWSELRLSRADYLTTLEEVCRAMSAFQDQSGAIIDPYLKREHQYSTPYYAYAVGTLLKHGRAYDLRTSGSKAMDHATRCFAGGSASIPDRHGEFFIAPLTSALDLYRGLVPQVLIGTWRSRLQISLENVLESFDTHTNNWRTYAMKGEWFRAQAGLVSRQGALAFIRDAWLSRSQRERIAEDKWNLYQDRLTDPESHAVEAVGRGNLLALMLDKYDGEYATEMWRMLERGTTTSLLLQDPTGQCPPNGRTDNHVFNDVLYLLCFEAMAVKADQDGESLQAARFHRAALLSYRSILRWKRQAAPWVGAFFVTKNRLDPAQRVGYQPASNYGNYNGALMYHLAEAANLPIVSLRQQPAPSEIGGYAFETDPRFGSAVANAGGMQVFFTLRGDAKPRYDTNWSVLGAVRLSRVNWDSRLGPSDGYNDFKTGRAVSLCPTWREGRKWFSVAEEYRKFQTSFSAEFVHPMLVRCSLTYQPVEGVVAPTFVQEFILTPDGVLVTLSAKGAEKFGIILPVLVDDGRPLSTRFSPSSVRVSFSPQSDEQCFISLNPQSQVFTDDPPVLSSYGWLKPVRMTSPSSVVRLFVYPRNPQSPAADDVQRSLRLTSTGFTSVLGTLDGSLYRSRFAVGGQASSADLEGDGDNEVEFDETVGFIVQLERGEPHRIEVDRAVAARVKGRRVLLKAFTPADLKR